MDKKRKIYLVIFVIIFLALTLAFAKPAMDFISNEEMLNKFKTFVETTGVWGVLALLVAQIIQIIIAIIPGEPFEVLSGAMYGGFWGTVLCLVGIVIGQSIVFLVVRKYGINLIQKKFSKKNIEEIKFLENEAKVESIIFILFLIPGTPKDILTYFAGLTKIKMFHFIVLTTIARLPSVISSTIAGDAFLSGNTALGISIFVFIGLLGILGIWINKKYLSQKNN